MAAPARLIRRRLLELPAELAASATVDALGVLMRVKPAMRTRSGDGTPALLEWADASHLSGVADAEGFVAVASSEALAVKVLAVDRSPDDHCAELGSLLGYPLCCVERIAAVGESAIDAYAESIAAWRYDGAFQLIDASGYRDGRALISHLPCSAECRCSLELARSCLPVAAELRGLPVGDFAASLLAAVR
jgi:hypothetical protein